MSTLSVTSITTKDALTDLTIKTGNTSAGAFVLKSSSPAINVTGALNQSKGAIVASAATTDIWTVGDGNFIHISGTTTITSFGTAPQAGAERNIIADGSFTITAGSNIILNNGGSNYTTQIGDRINIQADTTTIHYVTIFKADGSSLYAPSVRQTIAYGPVDTAGLPSFIPATSGSLSITAQNISAAVPLLSTAASALNNLAWVFSSNPTWSGALASVSISASASTTTTVTITTSSAHNLVVGSYVNLSGFTPVVLNDTWLVLTTPTTTTFTFKTATAAGATTVIGSYTNTNFLYVNSTTGATGTTIYPPIYQYGGTPSVNNGQFTFNISEMKGYMGNGSTAPVTPLVFVGEVLSSTSTITSSIAYAYNGYHDSGYINTLPSINSLVTRSHNIGVEFVKAELLIRCLVAEGGYSVGDITVLGEAASASLWPTQLIITRNALFRAVAAANQVINKSTFAAFNLTSANWASRYFVKRTW